jgi:hypothetical protein
MKIDPKEVKSIKTIGSLHDDDVKLVTTKGGLYLALGKKSKNNKKHDALAAGSHPALVLHQIEKEFKSEFQHAINKSESDILPEVSELNCEVKGLSMFSLKKGINIDVVVAKFGIEICKCECEISGNNLKVKRVDYRAKAFTADVKEVLRSQMNKGIIQTAEKEGFEEIIK